MPIRTAVDNYGLGSLAAEEVAITSVDVMRPDNIRLSVRHTAKVTGAFADALVLYGVRRLIDHVHCVSVQ